MMLSSLRIVASTIALWMLLCSVAPPGSTSATAVTAREEPSGSSLAGAAADTAAARAAGALVMMWRLIAGASPLSSSWWSLAKDQKRGNVPLLHLKDPGVAEEDLEDYEFYVYEQQQREEIEVKAATTKKETALPAVDTPSTLTCLEEGTCVLRVDEVSLVPNAEDDDRCDSQESSPEPHRASSPGNAAAAADGVIIEEESGASNVEADDDDDDASESPTTQDIVPADGDDSNGEQSVEVSETGADMGEPQEIPGGSGGLAVRDRIIQARQYMQDKVSDPNNSKYDKVRALCSNKHPSCAFWATLGECKANPAYMLINCAPVCESCEQIHIDTRCPMDAGDTSNDAWRKPGDLNSMFERIVSDPTLQTYQPLVLSRPSYAPGDVPENATYKLGLWMVQFENAISPEEADRLLELGMNEGYERSSDVGEEKPDGTFEAYVNDKRTSTNSWCTGKCYEDPVARTVMDRIANITGIPEINSENLQMLRYETGQFYKTHNDYIPYQIERQSGVRIATFYIYLNDVEEGGETNFPRNHNLSVRPKKGRAVLWPSVLDSNPNQKDGRSDHQAMPVIRGVKYGANAWIHQRDFKGPNSRGC